MAFNFRAVKDFFSDIRHFVSYREVLGVDIGTVSIKLVELHRVGEELRLRNYGILETKEYLERGNAAIQTSSLHLAERDVAAYLAALVNQVRPETRNAVASLPSFAAFIAPIEIPLLSTSETEKLVAFQARQYIPMPIERVNLEWVKVAEFDSQRGARYQRLLLTAIPTATVKAYQNIFRDAGLKLVGVELEMPALVRAALAPGAPPTLVVDIGGESTLIVIARGGVISHVAQTDYGGTALTQAVARALGISSWRAEELKRRRGLAGVSGEYDLSTSLAPFLDVIIQECLRAKTAYEKGGSEAVREICITGGGANLPGIRDYFSGQVNLAVQEPKPFASIRYPAELEPAMHLLGNELPIALGLAGKVFTAGAPK